MNYGIFNCKNNLNGPALASQACSHSSYRIDCIDAGTDQCPCYLALTGDCLTCTRLQGEEYCDCKWQGVCIYNEFIQGGRRINNPRKEFDATIIEIKHYMEDLVVYVLHVGKGFAIKASIPGTYLFIKSSEASSYYDIPISVMDVDVEKGLIHIAVKVISAKTKLLLQEKEKLIIRGPYRNGVLGIHDIIKMSSRDQKVLIIAKGIGLAPGVLASKTLALKNQVDFIIDSEKISKDLVSDYLNEKGQEPIRDDKAPEEGILKYLSLSEGSAEMEIGELLKNRQYQSVLILASDYYIQTLGQLVKQKLPNAHIAVSNNFHICCGEGICGACSHEIEGGKTLKMCKCQISGKEILCQ
ncbi:MAG: hypothetical protein ACOX5F_09325 [Anaerovoracaceae bacterium]